MFKRKDFKPLDQKVFFSLSDISDLEIAEVTLLWLWERKFQKR